jgi:hypothetical protein
MKNEINQTSMMILHTVEGLKRKLSKRKAECSECKFEVTAMLKKVEKCD